MNTQLLTVFASVGVAMASDFRVTVGISQITGQVGTGLDPNRIVPAAGDTITFSWLIPSYIQNPATGTYSVTQGTYDAPCKPMGGGFDSGPKTTGPENAGQAPTMTFQVKDDKPLYFFSSVDDQCKKGMVLGVNTPASGPGSVESYIIAAGGNPNADTTTNGTAPAAPASTNTTSTSASASKNNTSSTTQSKQPVNAGSTNSTSAKPQNSAAIATAPHSLFAVIGLLSTAFFL
ncbi:hypothetical protein PTTG_08343 [Puccinia triticina 1-1 BBBD Race 1]|uniref:Phytocyanin domain-containing protein n=2 Tax=Puccinia triticina TaxID=208348 RepID=A0A0C4F5E4_PUCT1|nr:uncharacterized protein PtA15_1A516 [Puccinia triticina]OAV92548.1 hypothetical protein PTTG_08343 [Puccinia triticina 1-1 BBBD Race 1]WAQ81177.1 hypothetical protein PtA15_1A516 [Puccinia triticina]WAR52073.1 hypothetical protein PtB15_1B512 [Puccinia triticina]